MNKFLNILTGISYMLLIAFVIVISVLVMVNTKPKEVVTITPQVKPFTILYKEVSPSVHLINISGKLVNDLPIWSLMGSGTGFFVTDTCIMATNDHVAVPDGINEPRLTVIIDGFEYNADVIATDELTDVALIQVKGFNNCIPLELEPIVPDIGSEIVVIGFPAGHTLGSTTPKITNGLFSDPSNPGVSAEKGEFFLHSAAVIGGNSGSPVLTREGKVIGVVSWGYLSLMGELSYASYIDNVILLAATNGIIL